MPTNEEMRERATSQEVFESLQRVIVGGIKATVIAHGTSAESSWVSSASKRIAKDVQHNFLAAFAASEVSRAVQECVEAQCKWCGRGVAVERRVFGGGDKFFYWGHDLRDDGDVVMCQSREIHELLYQQSQRASESE